MAIAIDDPKYRNDEIFVSHHLQRSKRQKGRSVSGDVYQEPTGVNVPWIDVGARKFTIDGSQAILTNIVYSGMLQPKNTYRVKFSITAYVAGVVTLGNPDDSVSKSAIGEYEEDLTFDNETGFTISADGNYSGDVIIDTIKRVG